MKMDMRQGCSLSSILSNLNIEEVIDEINQSIEGTIHIPGQYL